MKGRYVVLTGGKNNAGDFLIKHRALKLFHAHCPSREIVDFNAWEPFDKERLKIVNSANSVILLGGPSLQRNMRPSIYRMTENIKDISVPILTMGIGWKSLTGGWDDTYNYKLGRDSLILLDRINQSGFQSSVRDYHTLNALQFKKLKNFMMTGCPAYYDIGYIGKAPSMPQIKKVAFSLGVSFIDSPSMEQVMKDCILTCKDYYGETEFQVVFHHSLDRAVFLSTHNATCKHLERHNEFANWLSSQKIEFVDISGSARKMISYYESVDLHIGFRVHAHIFMNSVSKPSILISEDGRGTATKDVIGGIVLKGVRGRSDSLAAKLVSGLFPSFDRLKSNNFLCKEILNSLKYEEKTHYVRSLSTRCAIDENYKMMKAFLDQLP